MSFGDSPFTDRNGDYKQPTIVDMDKEYGRKKSYEKPIIDMGDDYRGQLAEWRKERLSFILSNNPIYLSKEYSHFIIRGSGKLEWDIDKVMDACNNDRMLSDMATLLENRIALKYIPTQDINIPD